MVKKIEIEQLKKLYNPSILDVRESYEYDNGNIPGSINIPLDDLLDDYDKHLKMNQKYYIYCETNLRSSRVCEQLTDLGYNVYQIDGGYKKWLSYNQK